MQPLCLNGSLLWVQENFFRLSKESKNELDKHCDVIGEAFRSLKAIGGSEWKKVVILRKMCKLEEFRSLDGELQLAIKGLFLKKDLKNEEKRRKDEKKLAKEISSFEKVSLLPEEGSLPPKGCCHDIIIIEDYEQLPSSQEDPKYLEKVVEPSETHPADSLLSQILGNLSPKHKVSDAHKVALLVRKQQMLDIIRRFSKSYSSVLLSGVSVIMNDLLADESKRQELVPLLIGMIGYQSPPKKVESFLVKRFPSLISSHIQFINDLLNVDGGWDWCLSATLDRLTTLCFKPPKDNVNMQCELTMSAFTTATTFFEDLQRVLGDREITKVKEEVLFSDMYEQYQNRFGDLPEEGFSIERQQKNLRAVLFEFCKILFPPPQEGTDTDQLTRLLISLVGEFLFTKLIQPRVIYSLVLLLHKKYAPSIAGVQVSDGIAELCSDEVFKLGKQKSRSNNLFIEGVSKQLFKLIVIVLKLAKQDTASGLLKVLESLIVPKLKQAGQDIEAGLQRQSNSVCLFLPFNLVDTLLFEQDAGDVGPSPLAEAMFSGLSDEEQLKLEIGRKISLKSLIEQAVTQGAGGLSANLKKRVVPSTGISNNLPPILDTVINNQPVMYLLIIYILKNLQPVMVKHSQRP